MLNTASQHLPADFTSYLKLPYRKYLATGLAVAVLVHLTVIALNYLYIHLKSGAEIKHDAPVQRIINVTLSDLEPPPSLTEEEIPVVKAEELSAPVKDLSALEPQPVAKEKADIQTIKTQKELEEIKTPVSSTGDTGRFTFTGNIKVEERKIEEKIIKKEQPREEKEKTVFQSFEVEKAPEAVNLQQVRAMISYPSIARDAGIEGRVSIKVLVNEEGRVIKTGSISGPEVFHEEVKQKVTYLEFTPGLQNGRPVKVWVTVPFNFKLN
ncbi:MAG: TonB family protein [Ignavibacteria bacterium]|nr:TonB family protein [Ignavibacteria bacterium]